MQIPVAGALSSAITIFKIAKGYKYHALLLKIEKNNTFPPWDSLGLLVCYRVHFSVLETVGIVCVAICLRSNHKMTGLFTFRVLKRLNNN